MLLLKRTLGGRANGLVFILICFFINIPVYLNACVESTSTLNSIVDNGDGTFTATFEVCFGGSAATNGESHGFGITINGATIISTSPTSITSTRPATINGVVSGSTVEFGDWMDTSFLFVGFAEARQCFNIDVVVNNYPTDWEIFGQEVFDRTSGPPADRGLTGCQYIGSFPQQCFADAGTNASPPLVQVCANQEITTLSTSGTANASGADPCIVWGFWVADDPLGLYPGLTGIGNNPSGSFPLDDPNFIGAWSSIDEALANGENPSIPSPGNGATYFIAPITSTNCQTVAVDRNCWDMSSYTQVYFNPEIDLAFVINCFDIAAQTTQVTLLVQGGLPSVDGSNFTLTPLAGSSGTLSSTSVADGGSISIMDIPNSGNVIIEISDGLGCADTFSIGPINAVDHCPVCSADAGDVDITQTGNGVTSNNNGTNSLGPFILCYGDDLNLNGLENGVQPAAVACCGPPPGCTYPTGWLYAVHVDAPTGANPFDPTTSTGFVVGSNVGDYNITNDGSLIEYFSSASANPVSNNTLYYMLTTIEAIIPNGDCGCTFPSGCATYDLYNNDDPCYDIGVPIEVVFLNEISLNSTQTCYGIEFSLGGGYPEFYPGQYVLTNTGAGNLSDNFLTFGETGFITGLNNGDTYSFTVSDQNGCPTTFTGTYNVVIPVPDFVLPTSVCETSSSINLSGTPVPGTSTTQNQTVSAGLSGTTAIPDANVLGVSSTINVSGFLGLLTSDANISVTVSGLNHTWVGDLQIFLEGPCGTSIALTDRPGYPTPYTSGSNENLSGDFTFTMSAGTYIPELVAGSPNISGGNYLPEDGFTDLVGCNLNGVWTITLVDNGTGDVGSFTNWSISLTEDPITSTGTFSGSGIIDNGDGTASFDPSVVGIGDIEINYSYDNGAGCALDTTKVISVTSAPIVTMSGGGSACSGDPFPNIQVDFGGIGPWSFTYSIDGSNQPVINTASNPYIFVAPSVGTYAITTFNDNNCNGNGTGSAIVVARPSYNLNETYNGCTGDGYSIVVNGTPYNEGNPTGVENMSTTNGNCDSIVNVMLNFTGAPLDPGCGADSWNVRVFDDMDATDYHGYYIPGEHIISGADGGDGDDFEFNTALDGWGDQDPPSDATGYVGCPTKIDSVSFIASRCGFGCAYYYLNLQYYDDEFEIWIDQDGDGTIDFTTRLRQATCCTAWSAQDIWEGYLGPNSEIEVFGADSTIHLNVHLRFYTIDDPVQADINATTPICQGENSVLTFNFNSTSGNEVGPFDVYYSDGTNNFVLNNIDDGYTVNVSPSMTTTYTIDSVFTDLGCKTNTDAVTVTVDPLFTRTVNANICDGDNYMLPDGSVVNGGGPYVDTVSGPGCDTIITTNLTVDPLFTRTVNANICDGDNYMLPDGSVVNGGGPYVDTVSGPTCDTIITTNITVDPLFTRTVSANICDGDNYMLPDGSVVNGGGPYIDTVSGPACDTIITTNLTVDPLFTRTVNANICDGDNYMLPDGSVVNGGGPYVDTVSGPTCDTIITTNLTVDPLFTRTVNANICDGDNYMLPDGSVVNGGGPYIDTVSGPACDTIITTNLTVDPLFTRTVNANICDGDNYMLPDGSVVNGGGPYVDTVSGPTCDTIITTNLTVDPLFTRTVNANICDGDNYMLPDGSVVNGGGPYIDTVSGPTCDTIITTNITVDPLFTRTVNANICDGDNYMLPDGSVVNGGGPYVDTVSGPGCDTIITTNLTVDPLFTRTVNANICDGDNYMLPDGSVVNGGGPYIDTVSGPTCDTIITTNLTVDPLFT